MARHSHSHSHSHSHDGAPADGPEYYVQPEDNLIGAIIFFAYIAAALILTCIIAFDLRGLSRIAASARRANAKTSRSTYSSIKIALLVLSATISFASLSFHMLNVLIQSYLSWTITHGAVDSSILYAGLFPFNLIDYLDALARSIWHWSTTSTLFADFASAIISSPARRIWTRLVLSYSLTWSFWMSDNGIQHHIPHLPLYFLLAQILPVSFTQHLFLLALELTRSSPNHRSAQHAPSQTRPAYITSLGLASAAFTFIDRDNANLVHSPSLIPRILLIRALLFAPLLVPRLTRLLAPLLPGGAGGGNNGPWAKSPVTKLVAIAAGWQVRAVQEAAGRWDKVAAALNEHPAVSAMGYDLGFALVGLAAYLFLEGRENRLAEREKGADAKPRGEGLQGRVDGKLKGSELMQGSGDLGLQERLDASLEGQAETETGTGASS